MVLMTNFWPYLSDLHDSILMCIPAFVPG